MENERRELKPIDSENFYTVWRLPYRRAVERTIALDAGSIVLTVAAQPRDGKPIVGTHAQAQGDWTAPVLELNGGPIHLADVGTIAAGAFQVFNLYRETFGS